MIGSLSFTSRALYISILTEKYALQRKIEIENNKYKKNVFNYLNEPMV